MIDLSESAVKKIRSLRESGANGKHLRVFVSEGGCSGLEYGMKLDDRAEGDQEFGPEGEVVIDPKSLSIIEGSVIHFDDGLNGTGFSIKNPNAKETCGCGRSFQ